MKQKLLWVPLLAVGAGLYWTTALGLGLRAFERLDIDDAELELVPAEEALLEEGVDSPALEEQSVPSEAIQVHLTETIPVHLVPSDEVAPASDIPVGRTAF